MNFYKLFKSWGGGKQRKADYSNLPVQCLDEETI